jgi:hypothetical protein
MLSSLHKNFWRTGVGPHSAGGTTLKPLVAAMSADRDEPHVGAGDARHCCPRTTRAATTLPADDHCGASTLRARCWSSTLGPTFRTLKHLLATMARQAADEDACSGHLVLRLLAALVLLSTARVILKRRVTMAEIVFRLKHHCRFLHSKHLELRAFLCHLPQRLHECWPALWNGKSKVYSVILA